MTHPSSSLRTDVRILWLDGYRGLASVLVVMGHMSTPDLVSRLSYSFPAPPVLHRFGLCHVPRAPALA